MFKNIMSWIMVAILLFAAITNLIRLLFLIKSNFSKTENYFTRIPTKGQLAMYYLLTILACAYGIFYKLNLLE